MEEELNKYFQGKLSVIERIDFLRRVETDEDLKRAFIRYKNLWAISSLSEELMDQEEGKSNYAQFIDLKRKKTFRQFSLKTLTYVASVAILIFSTWYITKRSIYPDNLAEIENVLFVPPGQRVQLTLQDGTEVWLNARTKLTYPALFTSGERRVRIEGEAFFEVAKEEARPFIVETKGVEMTVLGTSFNVYSYPETDFVQTSLQEGRLRIDFAGASSSGIFLEKGQEVIVRDGKAQVGPIRYPEHFLWKEGIFSFQHEQLENVLAKLELYYDVKIIVKDPSILNGELYTVKFRQRDSIRDILWILQQWIGNFSIEEDRENNTFILDHEK